MDELREMLSEEIRSSILKLSLLEPGSKEKAMAVDDLVKMYRLKIDESKLDLEFESKKNEEALKTKQGQEETKHRYLKIGIEAAGIILPLAFYAAWMNKGFKFEETGAFTSTTFRGLFSKFKPTK